MKDLPTHSSQGTSKCLAPSNGSSCKTNCGAGQAGPARAAAETGQPGAGIRVGGEAGSHPALEQGPTLPLGGRGGLGEQVRLEVTPAVRASWLSQASGPWPGCGVLSPSFSLPGAECPGPGLDRRLCSLPCSQGPPGWLGDRPG